MSPAVSAHIPHKEDIGQLSSDCQGSCPRAKAILNKPFVQCPHLRHTNLFRFSSLGRMLMLSDQGDVMVRDLALDWHPRDTAGTPILRDPVAPPCSVTREEIKIAGRTSTRRTVVRVMTSLTSSNLTRCSFICLFSHPFHQLLGKNLHIFFCCCC